MAHSNLLTDDQKREFAQNGVLVVKQFYDVEQDIEPIQRSIYHIIDLVMKRHGVSLERAPFTHGNFDSGYNDLIAIDRAFGGEVYDAMKQIPAFLRLICNGKAERLFCELRGTDLAGIGIGSYGIRIDNPHEEQFRSHWHQEFFYQPQSLDGIVMWTPLVPITLDIGPVNVCVGSHKDGLCKYIAGGAYAKKSGAYQIGIKDDEKVAAKYRQVAPLTEPGDLLIMDFLTIHQSGLNVSKRSRWSVQGRFFNFREPTGMRIGWKSSVTLGTNVKAIFAENFVEES